MLSRKQAKRKVVDDDEEEEAEAFFFHSPFHNMFSRMENKKSKDITKFAIMLLMESKDTKKLIELLHDDNIDDIHKLNIAAYFISERNTEPNGSIGTTLLAIARKHGAKEKERETSPHKKQIQDCNDNDNTYLGPKAPTASAKLEVLRAKQRKIFPKIAASLAQISKNSWVVANEKGIIAADSDRGTAVTQAFQSGEKPSEWIVFRHPYTEVPQGNMFHAGQFVSLDICESVEPRVFLQVKDPSETDDENAVDINFIIDTGASVCMISQEHEEKLTKVYEGIPEEEPSTLFSLSTLQRSK